jgi:hypothetical protein
MLPYINPEQFSKVSWLGSGSFGSVASATWHRKASLENENPAEVPVVLKTLQDRFSTEKALSLMLQEVGTPPFYNIIHS